MTYKQFDGKILSTNEEELLRASLLDGEVAINAWHNYGASIDIDTIDYSSQLILPLLYHNLKQLNIDIPIVNFLSGVYRNTWCRNEIVFRIAKPILRALHGAEIKTMLIEGMGLTQRYYPEHALRSIGNFSFLVPAIKINDTTSALEKIGFLPKDTIALFDDEYTLVNRFCRFYNDAGTEIEMYWRILDERTDAGEDDTFWLNAIPIEFAGVPSLVLSPADQLLHTCVNGLNANPTPTLIWVADAVMIMRHTEIEWEYLLLQTEANHLIIPMIETLDYLVKSFDMPVPSTVIDSLRNMPINKIEYSEFEARRHSGCVFYPIYYHSSRFSRYLQTKNKYKLPFGIITEFFNYLRYAWNIPHRWQVPYFIFAKSAKRILLFISSFAHNKSLKKSS